MTFLTATLLTATGPVAAPVADFSLLKLLSHTDWVEKIVMFGLALASLWVWTIIISFLFKLSKINEETERFERDFWKSDDVDGFYGQRGKQDLPIARVFAAGVSEWRRSTNGKSVDRAGTRERLNTAMDASIAAEIDKLSNRLNFLATTGAVAPFVGLFGTVWGIMRTIFKMGQNANMAVIAPGIAGALLATAIGLFAAIPAVIAYNRYAHRLNQHEARLGRFADGFHGTLSRELEREG